MMAGMRKRGNGEGSISRRGDGRWCARVSVHMPEGRKRKAFYGKTRKEAADKMAAWRGDPTPRDARITVGEWMDSWLSGAKSIGEGTQERYASYMKSMISPRIGGVRLARLTPATLEDWRDDLLSEGYAPETVKQAIGIVSTALGKASRRGLIPKNPASEVKRPKTPKKMRPLSENQAAALIGVARGTRWEALYRVAATVGLRHGELHALYWTDYDPERGTLSVERSVDTHTAPPRWGRTKTGEEREILLPEPVRECLERHRAIQAGEKLAASRWDDPRLVFPNQRGGVHLRNSVRTVFKRHLREAGLPDIRFHDLRHTAATLALRAGVDVATLAQILGHSDPAITLRRYSHVLSDMQRTASEKMSGYNF